MTETQGQPTNPRRIALIGFGEVGQRGCAKSAKRKHSTATATRKKPSSPRSNWEKLAGSLIGRVAQHGRRRATEMRKMADTETEMGL